MSASGRHHRLFMARSDHISRRLKLRQLNALLAVIEHGSMARAAQKLSVSQPVVSKAIADLEQTLGVKLLERGTRGVKPTIFGHAFAKRSTVVFDELRTSVSELEHLSDPRSGDLRIGSTEAMGTGLLPAIIDRMSRRYPRINFDVVLAQPWALQERALRGRRIDLFIGQRVLPETPKACASSAMSKDKTSPSTIVRPTATSTASRHWRPNWSAATSTSS